MESEAAQTNIICKHLVRKGMCYYGDKCKYIHPPEYFRQAPEVIEIEENAGKKDSDK